MQEFTTDNSGRLLISKETLLISNIYTDVSYRSAKSKDRFEEIKHQSAQYVAMDSLPEQTRRKVLNKYENIISKYSQLLLATSAMDLDCAPMAVEMTADVLRINEPFIRSSIETYIATHYTVYTSAYLDAGLHSDSVKGYAKQCALVQWMYNFVNRIRQTEPDERRARLLTTSFRVNMLTAVSSMQFEVKIPNSDLRFSQWFEAALQKLDSGEKPENIVQIKRKGNANNGKITNEQLQILLHWHKNGTNMSVGNLYLKWVAFGKVRNWWMVDGEYTPPTEGRLYQILQPFKNEMTLGKTDSITHRLNMVPTSTRELPTQRNHVWVIDGTAHNENVAVKNKVRQHVYAIKVMDAATMRIVGVSALLGVREPFYAIEEALLMGIRMTGCKPAIIQTDNGPGAKELERWCEAMEIKFYANMVGNSRGKTIESMFNMFDNDITRFLKGYSGQNRTAVNSINSKPSEKRETKGKQNARSATIAMDWLKKDGIRLWNERVIKQLDRKPCNKTPMELWDGKESATPDLNYVQICQLCGTKHERKLTIDGLEISHKTKDYIYFPAINTSEERAFAADIYTYYPLDKRNKNQLSIYILDGGKKAPVFDKTGRYLGIWEVKTNVGYTAGIDGTKEQREPLNNMMALQHRVTEKAKDLIKEIDGFVERHPEREKIEEMGNEPLTGKRREYVGRYDKTTLLEEEIDAKEAQNPVTPLPKSAKIEYKEIVDPDTGEIYRTPINNK